MRPARSLTRCVVEWRAIRFFEYRAKKGVFVPNDLLPAYLAVGADELKRRQVLTRMDARLEKAGGDAAFNREEFEGASGAPEPDRLRAALDTLPFGGDFRLVVFRDVDKAPKPVTEAIVSYLADPCPTTVLAMTASKQPKTTRLYKAVAALGAKAVIDCTPKKRWELPSQVVAMARARGLLMDEEAAEALVRLVGESTLMLDNEVGQLAGLLGAGVHVDARTVRERVPRIAEVKLWDVLDAVCDRDPALALRMLAQVPATGIIGLFTLAVSRLRELVAAKALAARGCPGNLASEIGMQAWQVKRHPAWARNYTMAELAGALRAAAACEADLKSSPDKELVFQRWLLSFCN